MSEHRQTFKADIDQKRDGFAGAHDLIHIANINRTLKEQEVLSNYSSIYLPRPASFRPESVRMLLVQGPHDEREGTAIFPLGLGYIARVLKDMGAHVEVLDAHAEHLSLDALVKAAGHREFNVVGITALSTQYGVVKLLAEEFKRLRPDAPVIVGGQLAHYNPHTVINHTKVDVCVIGEGEVTIQDILHNLDDLSAVAGIAYRDRDGKYRRNPDRPRIANPDAIPFPHWDAFKLDHYFHTGAVGMRARRAINVLSSRGCPYSCTFCSLSFPNVTNRSVDNVIAEIRELQNRYGVNGIMFADELFVIDKKRVYEFCEKLTPLKISWGGQGRANIVNNDRKLLKAMRDAGCFYVGYGLESATSSMLSKMQKKTTLEQNVNCVKAAHEVGLVVVAQYMFGFPGETVETVKAGVDYFKEVGYCPPLGAHAACHISLTTPLPGSQLYEDCKDQGIITDEDLYLEKISSGYFHNKDVIVNLTDFTDDELLDLKYAAQQVMAENQLAYVRARGRVAALSRTWKTIRDIYRFEGVALLTAQVVRKLGKHLARVALGRQRLGFWSLLYTDSGHAEGQERTDYIYRSARGAAFRDALKAPREGELSASGAAFAATLRGDAAPESGSRAAS
ncbi:MAG: cobalamin-dependent protein [Vicinamibacterales bacterium]